MVLLMHVVEKESLQYEGLHVWNLFIQRLLKYLLQVSPQVVATLMPFLEREQHQHIIHLDVLVEILKQLIVKNRELLGEKLLELPMLPKLSILDNVNQILQESCGVCAEELRTPEAKDLNWYVQIALGILEQLILSNFRGVFAIILR